MVQQKADPDRVVPSVSERDLGDGHPSLEGSEAREADIHKVPGETSHIAAETQGSDHNLGGTKQSFEAFVADIKHNDSFPAFSQTYEQAKQNSRPWKPLLFRLGPLSGFACMLLAILSIIVSLGILLGSNNAPVPGSYTYHEKGLMTGNKC